MAATPSDSPDSDPLIGRVLSGHYRIDARIGGGAMGTVYRAHHTLLEQDFAVKVLSGALANDPDVRRRFLVEARSLASFVHRNAVQVRDCGQDAGTLYLAMDLCPGETIDALLAREGALPPARAVHIAIQILDALDEAHRAGIVHRDLKPGNVMVEGVPGADGQVADVVRVVDFGLARIVGAGRGALPDAFTSIGGNVVGTVAYMSPEQLRADDDVDGRSDLFSVGVVLYEMLAHSSPFPGTSTMSIAMRIVDANPASWPAEVGPRISPAMNAVLARALAKRPADRYASAGEMAAALRAAGADGAPPFASTSRVTSAIHPSRAIPASDAGPDEPSTVVAAPRARLRLLAAVSVAVLVLASLGFLLTRPGADTGAEVARMRGIAALNEGRYADAVSAFSDVIDLRPRDGAAFLARARARTEIADRNAPADLDEADRLLKDDSLVATVRGIYSWRVEKDAVRADQAFVRALTLDPDNVEARSERAISELDRGLVALAEQDTAAIERRVPGDARVSWLRAQQRLVTSRSQEGPAARRALDEAVAFAREASAKDPRFADGAATLAAALAERAAGEKTRGEYGAMRKTLDEAFAASTLALARATDHPGFRGQGATRALRLYARAGIRFQMMDDAGALSDLDAALVLAPRDPAILAHRAYALQQTGDQEGAIHTYERLYDVTNNVDHLFRQGFGWQRFGDGRADVGDREGAVLAYGKAIDVYKIAMVRAPKQSDSPAYCGETRVRRARWLLGAEREAEWKAADDDFAEALRRQPETSETLLRRAESYLARRDAKRAYDDALAAIGGHKDRTPRFYARFAKAAMLRSREEHAAGRAEVARALAAEAVANATSARDLIPELAAEVVPPVAEAYVCVAEVATDPTARVAALASCEALLVALLASDGIGDGGEAVRVRATAAYVRAGAALASSDNANALRLSREAVDGRSVEAAAHRWYEDATFVERLADALAASGDDSGAKAARDRASRLPR